MRKTEHKMVVGPTVPGGFGGAAIEQEPKPEPKPEPEKPEDGKEGE